MAALATWDLHIQPTSGDSLREVRLPLLDRPLNALTSPLAWLHQLSGFHQTTELTPLQVALALLIGIGPSWTPIAQQAKPHTSAWHSEPTKMALQIFFLSFPIQLLSSSQAGLLDFPSPSCKHPFSLHPFKLQAPHCWVPWPSWQIPSLVACMSYYLSHTFCPWWPLN